MAHQCLLESVEWTGLESNEIAVVDGEFEVGADRFGVDKNGEEWLQVPSEWTRGPMSEGRVAIEKR